MKKIFLFLAFLTCVNGFSYERTDGECMKAAREVLQKKGSTKIKTRLAAENPQNLMEFSQLALWGYEDGGFAVISRETSLPPVLGYTDGPTDFNNMAPSLRHYLETLNGYLDFCLENGQEFKNVFYNRQNTSVSPLVKTKWDQAAPYYNMTPTYRGQHCLTGCVATAAAQVLNFSQLPKTCRGYTYYNTTINEDQRTRVACNYYDMHFDWDNMKNSYSVSNSAQKKAVAELMYACGVATNMGYGTDGSGAYPRTMAQGMNDFFDGIKATFYGSMVPDVVYEELDNGRPLCYSGANESGGHAFVIDGYDSEGLVHCNMGWSGGGDGYYTVTDMNGYPTTQDLIQVVPDDTPREKFTPVKDLENMTVSCDYCHPDSDIVEGKWYFLHNVGRSCHTLSQGKGNTLMGSSFLPIDEPIEYMAPHLVRFYKSALKGYYIQTGLGDYFGTLTTGGNNGTVAMKTRKYTCGKIADGYFWFKDPNGMIMDSNGGGSSVAGWGTTAPTDTTGNNAWQIFPAVLTPPVIDAEKVYYLQQVSSGLYMSLSGTGVDENDFPAPVILSSDKMPMTFTKVDDGWTMQDELDHFLGIGDEDWTMGVDSAATWKIVETGTENVFRISGDKGYLATDDVTEGSPVWRDKSNDHANGLWKFIEAVPSRIETVTKDKKSEGVRVNPFIVIENGRKILKLSEN